MAHRRSHCVSNGQIWATQTEYKFCLIFVFVLFSRCLLLRCVVVRRPIASRCLSDFGTRCQQIFDLIPSCAFSFPLSPFAACNSMLSINRAKCVSVIFLLFWPSPTSTSFVHAALDGRRCRFRNHQTFGNVPSGNERPSGSRYVCAGRTI